MQALRDIICADILYIGMAAAVTVFSSDRWQFMSVQVWGVVYIVSGIAANMAKAEHPLSALTKKLAKFKAMPCRRPIPIDTGKASQSPTHT